MSKPFSSRRIVPAALTLAVVAGVGLLAATSTHAQGPVVKPGFNPNDLNLQLKVAPTLQIKVLPQLQKRLLETKTEVAPAVLDQKFFLKADIPFIRLENGTDKALIPLDVMEERAEGEEQGKAEADKLPAEFEESRPYILEEAKIYNLAPNALPKVLPNVVPNAGRLKPMGFFSPPPARVDHRSSMSPVKDQGTRGTCVAHASNAALEAFSNVPKDLSEQYSYDLFMRKEKRQPCDDGGIKTTNSAIYLKDGTVSESSWAYTSSVPACSTTVPNSAKNGKKYRIASSLTIWDVGPNYPLSIKNPRMLEVVLNMGYNVVLGTHIAWGNPKPNGVLDVVINSQTKKPAASRGGHAMLICGYDRPGQYFIVKNSWGSGWGNGGYAYLSYDYIRTYAKYGYIVTKVSS